MTGPLACVAPTLTAAAAARLLWDVVIVGAGPAGAAAGRRLAAAGMRVIVVDRAELPRGKVCGCCLSRRAVGELVSLGVGRAPAGAVPLDRVRLLHRGLDTVIGLPGGSVVSREALDAALLRHAIEAECHWLPGLHVAAVESQGQTAHAVVHGGVVRDGGKTLSIPARFVLLATGLADHVRIVGDGMPAGRPRIDGASRLGIGTTLRADASSLPSGELVMAIDRVGYCGVVRLEDGRIDVAAALDRVALADRGGDVGDTVARVVEAAASGRTSLPVDAFRECSWRATPPLTRHSAVVAGSTGRILRIGDAAGYVEPFTGEGIGWALSSARLVTGSLLGPHGLRDPASVSVRHVASQRRCFAGPHRRCALVSGGLRRPAVVATAMTAARTLPGLARCVLPVLIGAGRARGSA